MKMPVELQYGDFGCADPEVEARTGQTNYNVKILMWITKDTTGETKPQNISLGVVYDEGMRCCMKGASNIAYLEKISQEEMEAILTDFDPIEVPALYFLYDFYSLDFLHF